MRKITKLSLVTILGLSSTLCADTLEEAFKSSKVSGEIKTAYVNSNFLGSSKADKVTAVGGSLSIKTGSMYGLKAAATFQSSSVLNDGIDYVDRGSLDVNGASKKVNSFNASGSVLSELYLEYAISNTTLKLGRQFMTTPLVSTAIDGKSSEAIVKDSFEAYVLTNTDLPNTTIIAGYIDKYQAQSDGNGDIGTFTQLEDGAYTIYAKNTSLKNLTFEGQYLKVKGQVSTGDKEVSYVQADYDLSGHVLSGQYLASSDKSQASNAQDGKAFGLRATGPLGLGKLGYVLCYNGSTDKNAALYTGLGEGADNVLFTAMPVHGGGVPSRADTDTVVGAVIVPVASTMVIPYLGKSYSKTHALGDVTAYGGMFIYPATKNLLIKAEYEHVKVENLISEDTDTTRIYLSYKF